MVAMSSDPSEASGAPRPRPSRVLPLLWWGLAALWNPWTFDWLLGSADLHGPGARECIAAVGLGFLIWGFVTLVRAPSRNLTRVHVLLGMFFLVLPGIGEAGLRAAMASNVRSVCKPALYASNQGDEDFWKLLYRWHRKKRSPRMDPQIGWKTWSKTGNPLGIIHESGYKPQLENVVLCFGDSFTAGNVPLGEKIPDFMNVGLEEWVAYNYGVGGYGVGQMLLRYKNNHKRFTDPVVVVGIYTNDLDRTPLGVRDAPKPRFVVKNGELAVENVPLPEDRTAWYEANPVEIKSYLLARIHVAFNLQMNLWLKKEDDYRRAHKRRVNRAVIEEMISEAKAHDHRLLFIVYPAPTTVANPGWRTHFMGKLFDEHGIPWIDGGEVMRETLSNGKGSVRAYYMKDDHPNKRGNRIFAAAILKRINELWGVPVPGMGGSEKQ